MMKHKSKFLAALAANFLSVLPAIGAPADQTADEPPWIKCAQSEPEQQLACYQQTTRRYLAERGRPEPTPSETAAEVPANHDWKLDHLWPVGAEFGESKALAGLLMQYRRNYLLINSIHTPSDAPGSPNPLNQVPPGTVPPHPSELKLQVSVKAPLPIQWPWGDTAWLAYTQQSNWQAFNGDDSRPFRETNYEPEFIYLSHRFGNGVPTLGNLTPRIFNLSFVHQSNGQALPRSRSWNRFTAELGSEYRFDDTDDRRFIVKLRPWWRVSPRNDNKDDNPDIVDYMGHGDLTFDYWKGRNQYSLLLRERAVQLDWSFPLLDKAPNSPDLHLQYFNGYGQSLIEYNHKLHSFGIGISLPY